jgi:methanogenic corrinoid protein MtbC1
MNVLDETRTKFIHQSTRELIEELYEGSQIAPTPGSDDSPPVAIQSPSGPRVVCIPARDEADEIVGTMVMQLLRRAGYDADALPISAVSTMLEHLEQLHPDVVCVSALPPFAAMQAKSLCKRLRQRCPKVKIALGLWEFPGGVAKAQERVGVSCADMIGTSLAQVVSLMGEGKLLAS